MRPKTILVLLAGLMASSASACKCQKDGVNDGFATQNCCTEAGGQSIGEDCPANSISEQLGKFAECCATFMRESDCPCPNGCPKDDELLQAEPSATPREWNA
ncbi:uncharacterized protein PG998_008627 [Apiospora kogelbergensis]|uniref:Uncharacterized protein n=1 Tax=Apiospora kogelbergensis TaxID=1337665 RepID=A0AAW0QC09_9PEZI